MEHVLVPCPAEHVEELRIGMVRLAMGMSGWTRSTAEAFLASLEGDDRLLVLAVAKAAAEYDRISYEAVARFLGTDVGSVLTRVTTINARCQAQGWPMPLMTDAIAVGGADGRIEASAVLTMVRPVALSLMGRSELTDPDDRPAPQVVDTVDW